jgi:hypothetical protein
MGLPWVRGLILSEYTQGAVAPQARDDASLMFTNDEPYRNARPERVRAEFAVS